METPGTIDRERYRMLARTIEMIRRAPRPLSLDEVAASMGLSRSQAQRAFTRGTGLSPQRFQATMARERVVERLAAGDSILDATMATGLSSPGRLHDLMVSTVAMTPGQVARGGAGCALQWGQGSTQWGRMVAGWGPLGMVGLGFADDPETAAKEQGRWQKT